MVRMQMTNRGAKGICAKNKENRKAVKHHQTIGCRSYPAHFHQLNKDKYNNEFPSVIEVFEETPTNRKTGCMSAAALEAYTATETKRSQAQPQDEHSVYEVLKERNSFKHFPFYHGVPIKIWAV